MSEPEMKRQRGSEPEDGAGPAGGAEGAAAAAIIGGEVPLSAPPLKPNPGAHVPGLPGAGSGLPTNEERGSSSGSNSGGSTTKNERGHSPQNESGGSGVEGHADVPGTGEAGPEAAPQGGADACVPPVAPEMPSEGGDAAPMVAPALTAEDGPKEDGAEENRGEDAQATTAPSADGNGERPKLPRPDKPVKCPRCESDDTKFCYYNNYNVKQPRHFCKGCQRYWTAGGTLRNVPVGAGRRKNKNAQRQAAEAAVAAAAAAAVGNADQFRGMGMAMDPKLMLDQRNTVGMFPAPQSFLHLAGPGPMDHLGYSSSIVTNQRSGFDSDGMVDRSQSSYDMGGDMDDASKGRGRKRPAPKKSGELSGGTMTSGNSGGSVLTGLIGGDGVKRSMDSVQPSQSDVSTGADPRAAMWGMQPWAQNAATSSAVQDQSGMLDPTGGWVGANAAAAAAMAAASWNSGTPNYYGANWQGAGAGAGAWPYGYGGPGQAAAQAQAQAAAQAAQAAQGWNAAAAQAAAAAYGYTNSRSGWNAAAQGSLAGNAAAWAAQAAGMPPNVPSSLSAAPMNNVNGGWVGMGSMGDQSKGVGNSHPLAAQANPSATLRSLQFQQAQAGVGGAGGTMMQQQKMMAGSTMGAVRPTGQSPEQVQ
mmetsp:Transcript_13689/g.43250  ORF Transcript_13689/g.43250 Transcript_13689/m.43250 type:complete len:642 (+) Transcript_13689:416-2341(+)